MNKTNHWIATVIAIAAYAIPTLVTQAQAIPLSATSTAPGVATDTTSVIIPLETLHLKVTAYTSLTDETDSTPFITANGDYVHDGIVATNLLPFGTKVEIPALFGNKVFTVDDRMSKKLNNNIDVWMPTRSAAITFGARMADIVVLSASTSTAIKV